MDFHLFWGGWPYTYPAVEGACINQAISAQRLAAQSLTSYGRSIPRRTSQQRRTLICMSTYQIRLEFCVRGGCGEADGLLHRRVWPKRGQCRHSQSVDVGLVIKRAKSITSRDPNWLNSSVRNNIRLLICRGLQARVTIWGSSKVQ